MLAASLEEGRRAQPFLSVCSEILQFTVGDGVHRPPTWNHARGRACSFSPATRRSASMAGSSTRA